MKTTILSFGVSLNDALKHVAAYCQPLKLAQLQLREALMTSKVAARASLRQHRHFRRFLSLGPIYTMDGRRVETINSILPDSELEEWDIEPWMFPDGEVNWETSCISNTKLTGYGKIGHLEFQGIKFFRRTTAVGVRVCDADLYRIWPMLKRQHRAELSRAGRKKGSGEYYASDTAMLKEVIAIIGSRIAATSDGAVNQILRSDPSRLVGKSDAAMKKRIRARYRDYERSGTLD